MVNLSWWRGWVGSEVPAVPATSQPPAAVRGTGALVVERALSVVGRGVYRLGKGGRRPEAPDPFDAEGRADCSGYIAWCCGLDRYRPGRIEGDWISTTAIYRDAVGPRRMFGAVLDAQPGDLLVYSSTYRAGVRTGIGHVGVVVEPAPTIAAMRVAHCAASRSPGGGAVRVSDGRPWSRAGIVVRLTP